MAIDLSTLTYANTTSPYKSQYDAWKKNVQAQRNADVAQIEKNRDADIAKSNAAYDDNARQNYINYMQAQKRLPSELNALGIRGGASESSLLRLGTNYGSNVASNNTARQNALTEIQNAYAKQIADYDRDLQARISDAEMEASEKQTAWEKEQIEKDLQQFSAVIEGLYNKRSSYEKLIKKLRASNDPNKEAKIMLATRAMNMLGGSGSGGGGSRRGYGGRGYGYGSSSSSSNSSNSPTDRAGATINTMRGIAGAMGAGIGSGAGHKPKGKRRTSNNGYLIHGETSRNWQ